MYAIEIDKPRKKLDLKEISTRPPKGMTRQRAAKKFERLDRELFELQELMFAARTHGLLVVLQGRDTAGKDGTIKHVVGCLNPRGVRIASFGVPTEEELAHDFLWRVHPHAPARGHVSIFNRSHYEDVLVVRVHRLAPREVWRARYAQINAFEDLLARSGAIVLKFFLHISAGEQEERLLEREQEPEKAWKLNVNDWKERRYWDDYTRAYEDAICRCASKRAPWYVVPADKKWFRNLVVAEAIAGALRPYRDQWMEKLERDGEQGRRELLDFRAGQ